MRLAIVLAVALTLGGCASTTAVTPAPPNSPQTTVALSVKTVADAATSALQTVNGLRDQGKLSQANTVTIQNWIGVVFTTDKQITAILANGQPWASQKTAILTQLATVTAPAIATTIDPGAQSAIAQVMTLVNQVKAQVQP